MAATTDFVTAQKVNRRNTLVLLVILTAVAALVGYVVGWALEGEVAEPSPGADVDDARQARPRASTSGR